jgi:hypothetical protein
MSGNDFVRRTVLGQAGQRARQEHDILVSSGREGLVCATECACWDGVTQPHDQCPYGPLRLNSLLPNDSELPYSLTHPLGRGSFALRPNLIQLWGGDERRGKISEGPTGIQ